MLFNSYIFILLFLPVTVLLYFLANRTKNYTIGKVVLIAASCAFVAYMNAMYLLMLLISFLINFCINLAFGKGSAGSRKAFLMLGIVFNVGFLSFFKYANFFVEEANILLPLGISFYTFQQIAFLVDNYRGEVPRYGFLDHLLFVTYFPKFIQGPIVYHNELLPQFLDETKKKFNFDNFSRGLYIFALGLTKKVLVADNFGKIVDFGYASLASLNSFEAILVFLGYTLQLYFDFSGYCDMAMGASLMLNIELPHNFNSPYKALNISDFWKRWHMTLTRFLTKYIYIPLGGNRKGLARTYANIILVFLVSGLWHGTGMTFVIWGALHGVASALYRACKSIFDKIPKVIQWFSTFLFVNVAWVFFRASNLSDVTLLFKRMCSGGFGVNAELVETMLQPTLISVLAKFIPFDILMIVLFLIAIVVVVKTKNSNDMVHDFTPNVRNWICTYVLLVLCILSISGVSSFLYVNF